MPVPPAPPEAAPAPDEQQREVARIVAAGDPAACDQAQDVRIGDLDYATVCRNNIAYQRAIANLDLASCDQLDGALLRRDDCQRQVIRLQLDQRLSLDVCGGARSDDIKEYCAGTYWRLAALDAGDPKLCRSLTGPAARSCEENLLLQLVARDADTPCERFSDHLASDCTLVRTAQSPDACAGVAAPAVRDLCAQRTAQP